LEVWDTSHVEGCAGGFFRRTWAVADSCGNSTEISQTITILPDTKAPVFNVSDSVFLLTFQDSIPDFTPEVSDNCSSEVAVTMEETVTGDECREHIVRVWTAT